MTIRHHASMGIDRFNADSSDISLLAQEVIIHHMKIHQPPSNAGHNQQENAQHRAEAPGFQACHQPLLPAVCVRSLTGHFSYPGWLLLVLVRCQR